MRNKIQNENIILFRDEWILSTTSSWTDFSNLLEKMPPYYEYVFLPKFVRNECDKNVRVDKKGKFTLISDKIYS